MAFEEAKRVAGALQLVVSVHCKLFGSVMARRQQVRERSLSSSVPDDAARKTSVGVKATSWLLAVVAVAGTSVVLDRSGHFAQWAKTVVNEPLYQQT